MRERASDAGKKLLAIGVLAVAAYVLFKLVIGVVTTIAWIIVVVLALVGIAWAVRTL